MRFSLRDALWVMAVAALAAMVVRTQRQAAYVQELKHRMQVLEELAGMQQRAAKAQLATAAQAAERAEELRLAQAQEIRALRQLVKQSLNDHRDWFEIQVDQNRIVAIQPGTTDTPQATAKTLQEIEAVTGLEGDRLRHFLTPIRSLRPMPGRVLVEQ